VYLEQLTFGDLEHSDDLHAVDSSFLKLFRLAQLTVEYLLSVQDSLAALVHESTSAAKRVRGTTGLNGVACPGSS
jgi:hypothetical protein